MVGRRVILAMALVVGTGLSACSGSDDRATPAATQPTTPSTAPSTTTTTAPPATVPDATSDFATRDPFEPQG
jgi:hypothetical protein